MKLFLLFLQLIKGQFTPNMSQVVSIMSNELAIEMAERSKIMIQKEFTNLTLVAEERETQPEKITIGTSRAFERKGFYNFRYLQRGSKLIV